MGPGVESNDQPIAETFSVKTSYGVVKSVPVIQWEGLAPYWRAICRAIFEVLIENDFHPYTATLKRPDGFVASSHYWRISLRDPTKAPLSEARFFIYKLKEKAYFSESIRRFNQNIQTNWLEEKNIAILGGYLYSFYYTLKPVLKAVRKGAKNYLKPIISKKQRM
jgi:hypothetical protein